MATRSLPASSVAHPLRRAVGALLAALALAAMLALGALRVGPLPPLGPVLDPVYGVWAVARRAELPAAATGRIAGLEKRVDVRYDRRGVPHIFAASEADAYRALGYVVARDRLFQVELQVRAGAGTLTELVGAPALPTDRETRALGLPRAAEHAFAALDTASPAAHTLRAYADGVNAWIDGMGRADLPLEYHLIDRRPARWRPIDAYHLLNRMSEVLSYDDLELTRRRVARLVGDTAARALFPVHNPVQQPIVPTRIAGPRMRDGRLPPPGAPSVDDAPKDGVDSTDGDAASAAAGTGRHSRWSDVDEGALGSNNWAVAPRRTRAGFALLAGDPHLEMTLPSLWYEVHLVVPGQLDLAGVTIPGGPGVILGFTRDLAWTFTNTGSDVLDYYAETVDDTARPSRYRIDGAWRPIERRVEVYRGPQGDTLAVDTVRYTHRGPLHRESGAWLSMRWTALEAGGALAALLEAPHARTAAAWLRATQGYDVPAQNMLVADRAGSIAIRSTGRYPLRPGDGRGDIIRDGSTTASDWRGALPIERYPTASDPQQGFLASDNQEPVDPDLGGPDRGVYLGGNWESPWRAIRINELLRADSAVTPDDMRRWQTDPGSARADFFVPYFLRAAHRIDSAGRGSSSLREAGALLGAWDRLYTRDNRQAVLFEAAMRELATRAWRPLAPSGGGSRVATPSTAVLAELLRDSTSAWWRDSNGRAAGRDEIVAASLAAAFDGVRAQYGVPQSARWQWRHIRQANFFHLLRIPALSRLGLPVQGGPETLNPSSGSGTFGPSWRMVVELGPVVRAWATYPGGQSGNPVSSRYADRLGQWAAGTLDTVRVPHALSDIAASDVQSSLTLDRAP